MTKGYPEASLKPGYIYEQGAESEHSAEDSDNAAERLKWLEKDAMSDKEIEQKIS